MNKVRGVVRELLSLIPNRIEVTQACWRRAASWVKIDKLIPAASALSPLNGI